MSLDRVMMSRPPSGILAAMAPNPYTIKITLTERPDPAQYANAVLGCQAVLSMTGLGDTATVWQDPALATDEHLGAVTDRWANHNPWS